MKKLLLIIISLIVFINPIYAKTNVKSENLEEALKREGIEPSFTKLEENKKQTPLYIFIIDGEEKSISLLKFLNNIYEEHKSEFKVIAYEVSKSTDNMELMNNTIDYLGANITEAPFMVMGDAYFTTYNESINDSIINTIEMYKDANKKTDKVDEVLSRYYRNDKLMISSVIIVLISLVLLFVYASFKGRKN